MSLLTTVWLHPRETARAYASRGASLWLPWAAVMGIHQSLENVMKHPIDPEGTVSAGAIVLVNILLGPIAAVVLWLPASWFVALAARLCRKRVSARSVRAIMSLAAVPYLPCLLVIIPMLLIAPDELIRLAAFDAWETDAAPSILAATCGYSLLRITMAVWSLVIGVAGLADVLNASPGVSFGVWLLGVLFFAISIALVALLCVVIALVV